jgi:hypothetical protein
MLTFTARPRGPHDGVGFIQRKPLAHSVSGSCDQAVEGACENTIVQTHNDVRQALGRERTE